MTTRHAGFVTNHLASSRRRLSHLVDPPARGVLRARGALGRYLSVRMKLTLWYGVMCAVTLGLLGVGMVQAFDIKTQTLIRDNLRTAAASMSARLADPGESYKGMPVGQAYLKYLPRVEYILRANSYLLSAPDEFAQVLIVKPAGIPQQAANTCLLVANPDPSSQDKCSPINGVDLGPEAATTVLPAIVATGRPQYLSVTTNSHHLMAYLTPLAVPPELAQQGIVGVLEVFEAQHTYIQIQQTFSLILLIGVPLGLMVALGAGWWIARAALRPINRISRTVHTIGESRDLSRRLDFVGPYDEVGRLAETFDGMMERLESVFETQKQFIADASHELRTPLTAIRGNADLLKMAPPEERELCIVSIRREAERMSRLVNDLLLLAAADVEEQAVHMQPVDLDDLLTDVYRSAVLLAGDKVTVRLEPLEPVAIVADPDRIKQLLLNLVDNAVKFTPAGGTITMSLYAEPEGARLEVCDTGIGIPPEEQEAIFRRFYRVEHARSKRGSGLGLAICEWIVTAHCGRLELQSEPGKGTTFAIHLPGRMPVAASREEGAATSHPVAKSAM